jgi:IS605 OrfB family transposase
VRQIVHATTKQTAQEATEQRQAIVFVEISGIAAVSIGETVKEAFQRQEDSSPFHEVKRQIECKDGREGVPVITLSRKETGNHNGLREMRGETPITPSETTWSTVVSCGV